MAAGEDEHGSSRRTLAGWVRLQLTTGLRSGVEVVAEIADGDLPAHLASAAEQADIDELVAAVEAEHRGRHPGPSADAAALVAAAGALVRAGVLVRLGDQPEEPAARADALARADDARRAGDLVAGAAYASRHALEEMVLTGRLELGVAALDPDARSAIGEQITSSLGLGHASTATLGQHVLGALLDAGLQARWAGGSSPVVVEPIDYAAPLTD